MMVDTAEILEAVRKAMPSAGVALRLNPGPAGQHSLLVESEALLPVMAFLREKLEFDLLSNVTGVDWVDPQKADALAKPAEAEGENRELGFLEVVYHLFSTTRRIGPLVLRARTSDRVDGITLPSVVSVYRSADFQEREVYDLFGVIFTGHPDLRRILMWDEFVDHPMRKDYVQPDDYEYEPTPHDDVLEKARGHYASSNDLSTTQSI